MDLIQSEARKSSEAATAQLQGVLSRSIRQFLQDAYALLAHVELILEYPEHEDTSAALTNLADSIAELQRKMRVLSDSFRQGRILREGMTVVIAGRPNSGKSSLLNCLAGFDRAIVTPIPGTTRDTIEEIVDMAGLPVRLVDTAGLRDSGDEIEQLGVDRARAALRQADLVFWLISPPTTGALQTNMPAAEQALDELLTAEGAEILETGRRPLILVAGKEDLAESRPLRQRLNNKFPGVPLVSFSAVSGEGLAELRQAILDCYASAGSPSGEGLLITNSRHKACLDQATTLLAQAGEVLNQGLTLDLSASLLRGCIDQLAAITGDSVTEALIDTIFSRFCVGK